jgi:5-methylcytosine-specific restriction endonuclease McrA
LNKEKLRESRKKYYLNHLAEQHQYYLDNKEHYAELHKTRYKEKKADSSQKRRHLKVNGNLSPSPEVVKQILELPLEDCAYCFNDSKELDHFIPIAVGGSHWAGNLVPSCSRCNRLKSATIFRTIEEVQRFILDKLEGWI